MHQNFAGSDWFVVKKRVLKTPLRQFCYTLWTTAVQSKGDKKTVTLRCAWLSPVVKAIMTVINTKLLIMKQPSFVF